MPCDVNEVEGRKKGKYRIDCLWISLLLDETVRCLYLDDCTSYCSVSSSEVHSKLVVAQWLHCLQEDHVRDVALVRRGAFLPTVLRTHQRLLRALLDDSRILSVQNDPADMIGSLRIFRPALLGRVVNEEIVSVG